MKSPYILILCILISCSKSSKEKKTITNSEYHADNSELIYSKDTISTQELMLLTKVKAIKKYGTPYSIEQFILDDAQGEFRVEISDKYTRKERQSKSILIDEVTWEKDKNTRITVWYEVQQKTSVPKHILVWEKGAEF